MSRPTVIDLIFIFGTFITLIVCLFLPYYSEVDFLGTGDYRTYTTVHYGWQHKFPFINIVVCACFALLALMRIKDRSVPRVLLIVLPLIYLFVLLFNHLSVIAFMSGGPYDPETHPGYYCWLIADFVLMIWALVKAWTT
jgi:hypothetical protein